MTFCYCPEFHYYKILSSFFAGKHSNLFIVNVKLLFSQEMKEVLVEALCNLHCLR